YGKNPLREKLALFWHGHFVISAAKVNSASLVRKYLTLLRARGTAPFGELLWEVSRLPAMLMYLDNRQNRKARPNENFARELLELFTLGIGHYSESDIAEVARSFSGHLMQYDSYRFT